MKKRFLASAILLIVLLLASTPVQAQVTIGSGQKPNAGALLDLKDGGTYSNGETANKGLALPRVTLTNIKPTTSAELAASIGSAGTWDIDAHIGLTVYNVKDVVFNPVTCITTGAPIGLYVWDGSQWEGLGVQSGEKPDQFEENIDPITGIGTVTDYEGNVYSTKRWTSTNGTKVSGIWMTENLLSIRKADGTFIDCPNGIRLNPAFFSNASGAVVVKNAIPTGTVGNYTNAGVAVTGQSYVDYVKEFGLLYNHGQAVDACPRGWRLPSDADWDLLAESMNGAKSGANYNGIGHVMKTGTNKNFTSADGTTSNWTNSATVAENGFNALPSGYVDASGLNTSSFGVYAYWWSASTSSSYRGVGHLSTALRGYPSSGLVYYFPLRCVKN